MNNIFRDRMGFRILACAFVSVVVSFTAAADIAPPVLVGQVGGILGTMAADGDYLYACEGTRLVAYRVDSETGNPTRVSDVQLLGTASRIAIRQQVAYVTTEERGLCLVDISNPASMAVLSSVPLDGPAQDMVLGDTVAYVSWADTTGDPYTGGVSVVDISSLSSPAVVGAYIAPSSAGALSLKGTTLYVAWKESSWVAGCDIVDVTTPALPVLTGSLTGIEAINAMHVSDDALFLLLYGGTLAAFDLATLDSSVPVDLSTALGTLSCSCSRMVVSGTIAYGGDDLTIVDLSDPTNMTILSVSSDIHLTNLSGPVDGKLYGTTYSGQLAVVDVTDLAHPVVLYLSEYREDVQDLCVSGDRAYLLRSITYSEGKDGVEKATRYVKGFDVVDISDPTEPVVTGSYRHESSEYWDMYGMAMDGDLACFLWAQEYFYPLDGQVDIVDVSDSSSPQLVGSWSKDGCYPASVTLDGTTAYVVVGSESLAVELYVLDLTIPSGPIVVGSCGLSSDAYFLAESMLYGEKLYILRTSSFYMRNMLEMVNVSDPTSPYVEDYGGIYYQGISTYPCDLAAASGVVYVATRYGGMSFFPASDISDPSRVSLGQSVLYGIAAEFDRLYFVNSRVLGRADITEPLNPVALDTISCTGGSPSVKVQDGLIYVADRTKGLRIFDDGRRPLTIAVEGHGTTDPAPGAAAYEMGTPLTITAIPETGYKLDHWTGDVESGTTANPLVVTVDAKKSVTAVFAEIRYTLTTSKQGVGYTDPVPGSHSYLLDEEVTVTATPEANWVFDHWEGDFGDNAVANPIVVAMTEDKAVTAVFAPVEHTLTMAVSGQGSTMPAVGVNGYPIGAEANVTATAVAGWRFDHWEGDFGDNAAANPIVVTLDQDRSLTAVFVQTSCALSLSVEGQGTISPEAGEHTYTYGTQVTLTATPADGWRFERWDNVISKADTDNSITVTVDRDLAVVAVFVEDTAGCSGGTSTKSDAATVGLAALGLLLASLFRGAAGTAVTKL